MTETKTTKNDPFIAANNLRQALKNARSALIDVKGKLKIFDVAPWPWLLDEIERAEKALDRNAPLKLTRLYPNFPKVGTLVICANEETEVGWLVFSIGTKIELNTQQEKQHNKLY